MGWILAFLLQGVFIQFGCANSPSDGPDADGSDADLADLSSDLDGSDQEPFSCLEGPWMLSSPSGRITIEVSLQDLNGTADFPAGSALYYRVLRDDDEVLGWSPLGIATDTMTCVTDLCVESTEQRSMSETYQMTVGKQRQCAFEGVEQTFAVRNDQGDRLEILFRAHDDGIAFRYRITGEGEVTVMEEESGFAVPSEARGWMALYDVMGFIAGSYELVPQEVTAGESTTDAQGWAFPALFEVGGGAHWLLLTEADLDSSYCGTRLHEEPIDAVYRIRFPSEGEGNGVGEVLPHSSLPMTTPWRVLILGDLSTIVKSTLVTDLSSPCLVDDVAWIRPGRVAWSWFTQDTGDLGLQQAYVDFAARMSWEYVLVDARWDQWPNAEQQVQQLVQEAGESGVRILLWYNSGGEHSIYQNATPIDRMLDPEVRRAEMERLQDWGVAGIKVDFFDSDKQDRIQQYLAILEDAGEHHLLVNFHGATLPRGWQRTYPHLMSHEAVHGAEHYKLGFDPPDAYHHVLHVFMRNVVGSMDYTPVVFEAAYESKGLSYAHSLALSVVFESGFQHFADRADGNEDEGYGAVFRDFPFVETFMRSIPVAWEETVLLEGEPDRYAVLARRHEDVWYLAGINGLDEHMAVSPSLSFLPGGTYEGRCISSGETATDLVEQVSTYEDNQSLELVMKDKDGVVCVLRPQ